MSDASLIPDSIGATLGDLVGLYSQVEAIKLNNQLALARASAAGVAMPTTLTNSQAYVNPSAFGANGNNWLLIGGVIAAGLVVYMALK